MAGHYPHLFALALLLSGCRSCNWGEGDTALHTGDITVDTDGYDTAGGGDDSGGPPCPTACTAPSKAPWRSP